ncbi:MAG: tRNA adenosine(34) deaminase TadA [Planctomycetota bacterium]
MTDGTDRAMMRRAMGLAREASAAGEVPVGAVVWVTDTGEVIGEGRNRREGDRTPWAHAEFLAIQRACEAIGDWRLNHCSLAVTLEPCPMCAGLIVNARVGRLVFAARDPKAGATGSLMNLCEDARLNHRCEVVEGLLAEESSALLTGFFRSLRER